jgi:homocitrate synthase NifV
MVPLEIYAHNDFGMAVASSVAAVKAGVDYVNCIIGGLGERAGNCDYIQFVIAAKACFIFMKKLILKN